ncbi:cytochrome C oxidase copper chaperone-domain-containing protein, partial [Mycena floridula]
MDKITAWWSPKPYDPTDPKVNPLNPKGLKPCCACPQTKSARDDCFLKFGTEDGEEKCKEVVQSHLACMRSLGFKI